MASALAPMPPLSSLSANLALAKYIHQLDSPLVADSSNCNSSSTSYASSNNEIPIHPLFDSMGKKHILLLHAGKTLKGSHGLIQWKKFSFHCHIWQQMTMMAQFLCSSITYLQLLHVLDKLSKMTVTHYIMLSYKSL